jgi:hypothetical protein
VTLADYLSRCSIRIVHVLERDVNLRKLELELILAGCGFFDPPPHNPKLTHLRFEVPMQHPLGVHVFQREADLHEPEHDLVLAERLVSGLRTLLDPPIHVALFRKLHYNLEDPRLKEALVVPDDVRVVQFGQHLHLAEGNADT